MNQKSLHIQYKIYDSIQDLDENGRMLFTKAKMAAKNAHAPYSKFLVGAAVQLSNSQILIGNNQENASYPVGICAERTVLSYVKSNFPEETILRIAIFSPSTKKILTPCGMCRQSLIEYEKLQQPPIEVLLTDGKKVLKISSAQDLLPFQFDSEFLID